MLWMRRSFLLHVLCLPLFLCQSVKTRFKQQEVYIEVSVSALYTKWVFHPTSACSVIDVNVLHMLFVLSRLFIVFCYIFWFTLDFLKWIIFFSIISNNSPKWRKFHFTKYHFFFLFFLPPPLFKCIFSLFFCDILTWKLLSLI